MFDAGLFSYGKTAFLSLRKQQVLIFLYYKSSQWHFTKQISSSRYTLPNICGGTIRWVPRAALIKLS